MNVGTGDKGITSLLSGERVPKTHVRVEACGELDELASVLGALASSLPEEYGARARIAEIQVELLHIGAWVASSPGSAALSALRPPSGEAVQRLEQATEQLERELPRLQGFILPGGSAPASWAHVARSVCRRAERRLVALARQERVAPGLLPYLNRLSDLLFALARRANQQAHTPETTW